MTSTSVEINKGEHSALQRKNIAVLMAPISPVARLLFGVGLLWSAIRASNYSEALITLLIVVVTIVVLLEQPHILQRTWRYLRWFLLPVILLHLLFTPGMLLLPDLPWSPSREGVTAALWQSLRLINWFFSGYLFTSLLSHHEWRQLLARLPGLNQHWGLLLTALPPMLQRIRHLVLLMRWRWQHERGTWHDIPAVATVMVATILNQSATQAESHWLSGNGSPAKDCVTPSLQPLRFFSRAWLLQSAMVGAGWSALWTLW